MENNKIIDEFEWNPYREQTGCPSVKVVLAYEDKDFQTDTPYIAEENSKKIQKIAKGGLVRNLLEKLDMQRAKKAFYIHDEQTGLIENAQTALFSPAKFNFDIDLRTYGAPHEMPYLFGEVKRVPSTPREFLDAYGLFKGEGIDILLVNPGNDYDIDQSIDYEYPAFCEREAKRQVVTDFFFNNNAIDKEKGNRLSKEKIRYLLHKYEFDNRPLEEQIPEVADMITETIPFKLANFNKLSIMPSVLSVQLSDTRIRPEEINEIMAEGVMEYLGRGPNKPARFDVVPEDHAQKYLQTSFARLKRKGYKPSLITRTICQNKNISLEKQLHCPIYSIVLDGRPEIKRSFFDYNEQTKEFLKEFLPAKLHTQLSYMHGQIPSTQAEQRQREAERIENDYERKMRILSMRERFYTEKGNQQKLAETLQIRDDTTHAYNETIKNISPSALGDILTGKTPLPNVPTSISSSNLRAVGRRMKRFETNIDDQK